MSSSGKDAPGLEPGAPTEHKTEREEPRLSSDPTRDKISTRDELLQIAQRIRARTAQAVIETGRDLIAAKKLSPHGDFAHWLKGEVGIEPKTAQRYMRVAQWADSLPKDKNDKLSLLPNSALYDLSAKSTPEPVREAVFEALKTGEPVNVTTVRTFMLRAGDDAEEIPPKVEEAEPSKPDPRLDIPKVFKRKVKKSPQVEEPPPAAPIKPRRAPTKRQLEAAEREAQREVAHTEICAILRKLPEADLKRLVYLINEDWGLVGLEDSEAWRWIQLEFDPHDDESATVSELLRGWGIDDTAENRERARKMLPDLPDPPDLPWQAGDE